jgi:serine/threonine protein kinase
MGPNVPSRVRDLFHAAIAHPADARLAYLENACAGDRALYDEVAELLELYSGMETDDDGPSPEDGFVGMTVGAYRIVRLVGSGGMGRVYLGRRADGAFERDVAVKVIDPEQVDDDLVARFEQERRILGSLSHPCIAELFDAGRTDAGHLYFVMEYIDGMPITDYCDRQMLGLRDRLRLFLRVCDGVAAAHRNLIVHRDLKPGNILVDPAGVPRLVDFGIAKPITRAGLEAGDPTLPFQKRVTPAYASPEQIQGEAATTAMDIFSLGVVLHELVTGSRPWRTTAADTTGAPFQKPSAAFARERARLREASRGSLDGSRPPMLRPTDLAGDLDAILLKTLAADARLRYRSTESLAQDLERYLAHRPIEARTYSAGERARRLIKRNRVFAAMSAVAAVALIAAIVGLTGLWLTARRDRDRNARLVADLVALVDEAFAVDAALASIPQTLPARRRLAQATSKHLSTVPLDQNRALALSTAEGFRRLGDIQGNPNGPNLGEPSRAIESYEAALGRLEPVHAADAGALDALEALARTHASLADVYLATREPDRARDHYMQALSFAEGLTRVRPDQPGYRSIVSGIRRPLGDMRLAADDPAGALVEYERALAIDTSNAGQAPDDPEYRRLLGLTWIRIGAARAASGSTVDARAGYEKASEMLSEVSSRGYPELARELALGRLRLGRISDAEGQPAGRQDIVRAVQMFRELSAADPADARARRDLVAALVQYADVLEPHDRAASIAAYREARDIAIALETSGNQQASRDIAVINRRISEAGTGMPIADLELFRIVDGRRQLLLEGDRPPRVMTDVVAVPTAAHGLVRYLLVFGAQGPARILDEAELLKSSWTVRVAGPPPAQTILLLALPRALSPTDQQRLVADVDAAPGDRTVDWDSQIDWSPRGETINSAFTARGDGAAWVRAVRERILRLGRVVLAGRTFPVRSE